jgi:hypothetical protein
MNMKQLTENDLKKFGKTFSLSKRAIALVNHQKVNWPSASSGYSSLRQVQTRTFKFGHFRIDCQFNPGRIRSSAANTDATSIKGRPCFLCESNRPPEQSGIPFGTEYVILCNPFPIFPYHLTVSLHRHQPQLISGHIESFLHLSRDLQEFVVFYNGPLCGASAPDHFHFQAGIRDVLPIEEELKVLLEENSETLLDSSEIKISAVENFLRRFIFFHSSDQEILTKWVKRVLDVLLKPEREAEPMVNLLGWFTNGYWQIVLFPREAQRPREYFADDFDRILVSPAAVELGGLVVLPREEDFYKITAENLESIFSQVTLQKDDFEYFKEKLIKTI